MSETTLTAPVDTAIASEKGHAAKYTRNQPYLSRMLTNERLTGPESEKETIHVELEIEDGMTYTPGDAVGIIPTNREAQVESVLKALGFDGTERVADHYKVEISLHEALTSRLGIGKLARGSVNQFAKLCGENPPAGLKALLGPENKALAEEYVWGREFIDLVTEFPGVVTEPQQLFNILQRLTPRMYSIASSQAAHPNTTPVIASGGVGSIEDLLALRAMAVETPGIEGVIVGRALYDGRIKPAEALEALSGTASTESNSGAAGS